MFPRGARPLCIYKLHFPLGCDGDLKRFLQNKPSVQEWRHVPSALKERERVQMAGKKRQKMGTRQNKLTSLHCQAQFPTGSLRSWLCGRGMGAVRAPGQRQPAPATRVSTTATGFYVPAYQTPSVFTDYVFLRRLCA